MTTKNKPGFGGQFVEEIAIGKHKDESGQELDVTREFLEQVIKNYDPAVHEAPATIGHPKTNAPAFGWVSTLRINGNKLENQFVNTDPQFEEMVRDRRFPKRSVSFYVNQKTAPPGIKVPYLRHIGFLGAQPPAVKGLKDIEFSEGEEAIIFEFSEGATMNEDEKKAAQEDVRKTVRETISDFFKKLGGSGGGGPEPAPATAAFSEADQKKLVDAAVEAATTAFSETLKERDKKIEALQTQVARQAGSTQRGEILAFCEKLQGQGKFVPAFKNMGIVDFMEVLSSIEDSKETKVSVVTFAEENGKEVEKAEQISPSKWFQNFLSAMPAYVQFGERFGNLSVTGNGEEIVDPKQLDALRSGMGVKPQEATK